MVNNAVFVEEEATRIIDRYTSKGRQRLTGSSVKETDLKTNIGSNSQSLKGLRSSNVRNLSEKDVRAAGLHDVMVVAVEHTNQKIDKLSTIRKIGKSKSEVCSKFRTIIWGLCILTKFLYQTLCYLKHRSNQKSLPRYPFQILL